MPIALRHPRFGRLLAALATSALGDWLYNLALLAYVQQRTHSTTWLGMTTAARVAPLVIGGPLGGLLADRLDRRVTLIVADVARALLMGGLVVIAAAGLPVLLVPVIAAAATAAGVASPSCIAAATPQLVPAEELGPANAARGMITPACVVAGPGLGAVLLLLGPPELAFALNAVTFLISAALVLSIPAGRAFAAAPGTSGGSDHAGRPWTAVAGVVADLGAGARTLIRTPEAGWLVGADVAGSFVFGAQTVLLLAVAERMGLHAAGYGYLLAAQGLGGILGASIAGRLGSALGRRGTLAVALGLVGLPLPLLTVTTSLPVALVLGIVAGTGALIVEVAADTRLQQTLDEARLGTCYGFAFAASVGGIAVGGLAAPLLVSWLGVSGALVALGVAVLALALRMSAAGRRTPPAAVPSPAAPASAPATAA